MIISYKHKLIFTKPQKTAGTSVELMLSRICGSEDVITPLGFDPDPNVLQNMELDLLKTISVQSPSSIDR